MKTFKLNCEATFTDDEFIGIVKCLLKKETPNLTLIEATILSDTTNKIILN